MSVCLSTFLIIQFCSYTICYHEVLEVLEELVLSLFDGSTRTAGMHTYMTSVCLLVCLPTFFIIQFCSYTNCYHEVLEVLEELVLSLFDGSTRTAGMHTYHVCMPIGLSTYILIIQFCRYTN